jgi:hypothetical protein
MRNQPRRNLIGPKRAIVSLATVGWLSGIGILRTSLAETEKSQIVLYSLDPQPAEPGDTRDGVETFHGYPVLGKVAIVEPSEGKEIILTLRDKLTEKFDSNKAFSPRYGVHVSNDRSDRGSSVDLVIDFDNGRCEKYIADMHGASGVPKAAQATFDKYLKRAGLPLTKPTKN